MHPTWAPPPGPFTVTGRIGREWYYKQITVLTNTRLEAQWSFRWNKDNTRHEAVWQSRLALLYTRKSKERRQGRPPTPENTLCIYSSSAILEPPPMPRCTIWISSHDLTHHQHNFLSIQPRHIIGHRNTSDHFLFNPNYTTTILPYTPCLPTSPPFCNTIHSTPFLKSHLSSKVSLNFFKEWLSGWVDP